MGVCERDGVSKKGYVCDSDCIGMKFSGCML